MSYPPQGNDPYGQQPYGQQQPYQDPYQVSGAPASPANPYGQQYPPAYQAGSPMQNMGTNTMAIVFGHMAKKQIKETGEQGDGLATAGLILGYVFTGITVLICCGYAAVIVGILGSSSASTY